LVFTVLKIAMILGIVLVCFGGGKNVATSGWHNFAGTFAGARGGARVPFAVVRGGYFFRALAEVDPRFHTPSVAIVGQAALSIVLLLLGANFRQLFSLAIFAEWLFYMIAGSTIFVFRRREPAAARPYRMRGYPVVPAAFVAVAALLCYTFKSDWPNSG
jgi:APA family basic amino acid/polyamine antiporter